MSQAQAYNNVFVNKLVSTRLDLSIYNITYLYIYIYIYIYKLHLYRLEIELYKLVNKYMKSQIIICNLLII
jgi:hypothetical protein